MKATSLFGGVQVVGIIITIIRTKFIAVLLGPVGMGIAGLLNGTIGLIAGIADFGLGTSAIKDVAAAYGTGNAQRVATVVKVFRRWIWITGLLGTVITLCFSPLLSQFAFGNKNYTFAFIWISITLLLGQISSGQNVVLRGMRKVKEMAKASLIGSILGLFTTIPLYYFFGLKGIVPGIIIASVTSLLLTWYYAHKIKIEPVYVSKARTVAEGKDMLKMGFMLSLNGLITSGTAYLFRVYLSRTGGVDQVGLYNAGFAMINTYVGLIFTAMSMDYYPRLSALAHSNALCTEAINQQAEIAILILAPIILIFLVFIHWVVVLLYSHKFTPINDMILWAAYGMLFKASSWAIGFILLAKGASKLFFFNELFANLYVFGFNIIGYNLDGLTGLGISFMVGYIIYLIQVHVLSHIKYSFSFNRDFIRIFIIQFLFVSGCFIVVKLLPTHYAYGVGSILIILSGWYSYKELDKRLDLKNMLSQILHK
ncbi:O-antigen translocase [Microbacter margulisiae]|uniref:O-antigen/teichoic acid export membrane protein n=1 Tax=Microbacter margulisiae TaxID=1350067 RepID=A0A7W5DNA6_9PORP|nr:O-antigen translocase [Microbacter margulisiae]MBB3185996.1 O-antigen/teichoic acid export membrane protein [Microbacter margulisiae]